MRTLSSLGFKSLGHRRGRSALAALGVCLGVALLFGVLVANASVTDALDRFASAPTLNVVVRERDGSPLPFDMLARAVRLPHIRAANVPPSRAEVDLAVDAPNVRHWIAATARPALGLTIAVTQRRGGTVHSEYRQFLDVVGRALTGFSAVALFVGTFFVYLALSGAVLERTQLYGTLRAIGTTTRQLRRLVVSESLILGIVASVAGLALGLAMAVVLVRLEARAAGVPLPATRVPPVDVVAALLVGTGSAVLSALGPARQAARLDPVVAMRGDVRSMARLSRWWLLGIAAVAAAVVVALRTASPRVAAAGVVAALIGAVLMVPVAVRPLAAGFGRISRRTRSGASSVPVLHLVKERSRSASTLAVIMVVLAMGHALLTASATLHDYVGRVFRAMFGDTLVVDSPLLRPLGAAATVEALPAVRAATDVRIGQAEVAGRGVTVVGIDPSTYFRVSGLPFATGDATTASRALAAGGGAVVPTDLAQRLGVRRGSSITIDGDVSARTVDVVGTYQRFGFYDEMGIVVGRADATAVLGLGGRVQLRLVVDHRARPRLVQELPDVLLQADRSSVVGLGSSPGALVVGGLVRARSSDAIRAEADAEVGRFLRLIDAIVLIALVVGVVGLTNTLLMSSVQRTREIGLLRAVGLSRAQARTMVLVESLTLCLAGAVLAVPLGMLLSALVGRTDPAATVPLLTRHSVTAIGPVVVLAVAAAAAAAVLPARRAARLDVVEALRLE